MYAVCIPYVTEHIMTRCLPQRLTWSKVEHRASGKWTRVKHAAKWNTEQVENGPEWNTKQSGTWSKVELGAKRNMDLNGT